MAVRYDTGIEEEQATQIFYKNWGGGATQYSDFTSRYKRTLVSGDNIDAFHKRAKGGELLPHTSFSSQTYDFWWVSGYYHAEANGVYSTMESWEGSNFAFSYHYKVPGMLSGINDFIAVVDEEFARRFIQQAAGRIYTRGYDALTFAGEIPKLRKMFRSILKRLLRYARSKNSRDLYRLWLEGRYGWRTLAYDIRDFNEALTNFDEERRIYSERAGTTYNERVTNFQVKSNPDFQSIELTQEVSNEISVRGAITGRIQPARISFNPILTGWELVPFSFIIDWLYDVGSALEAASFRSIAQEYTASVGSKIVTNITNSITGTPASGVSGSLSYESAGRIETISRSPSSIPTLPQLSRELLKPEQLLDLTALAKLGGNL